jgi:predicted DNA-binding WGR domain protein
MWGYESYKNVNTGKVRVVFYWGKIADSLQKLQMFEKEFDHWGAIDLIRKKIDDKLRKGYVAVLNSEYTKFSCGQISIGQFIQIIENQKGEANSLSLF